MSSDPDPDIQRNIFARNEATAIIQLIEDSPGAALPRMWELIAEHAAKRASLHLLTADEFRQHDRQGMSEREARAFEECLVGFGQHRFHKVGDVPTNHLEWLAENVFIKNLQRYVRSTRFAERDDS